MTLRLDFVAVGPQRTGTTWMYQYLLGHPDVFVSDKVKESFYFDREFTRGDEWYARLFAGHRPGATIGEVAPTYFASEAAPQRLLTHSPGCTVIVTLREPVGRMVSLYRHLLRIGTIPAGTDFEQALLMEPVLIETSRYAHHLQRWTAAFGSPRVQPLLFERLADDPDGFAAELCRILQVPVHPLGDDLRQPVNAAATARMPMLSHLADRVAAGARRLGLHTLVNRARRARLVLERSPDDTMPVLGVATRDRLRTLVHDEEEALRTRFAIDTAVWQQRWKSLDL